jgi:hypothetical protein
MSTGDDESLRVVPSRSKLTYVVAHIVNDPDIVPKLPFLGFSPNRPIACLKHIAVNVARLSELRGNCDGAGDGVDRHAVSGRSGSP